MNQDQVQGKSIEERIEAATSTPTPEAVEEVKTQPEPMPSLNQNPTEVKTDQTAQAQEDDLTLPENASERTRAQFEKLKARLKEAEAKASTPKEELPAGSSVFDVIHPEAQQPPVVTPPVNLTQFPGLNPLQVQNITQQFVDAEGNVDINGLNRALYDANQRTIQASQRVQSLEEKLSRFEETQQVKEAHSEFPQLDPTNREKFDKNFYELVRDRLVRNMWEGTKKSLAEVARELSHAVGSAPVNRNQVEAQAVEQYKAAQQARIQGPIEQGKGEVRQADETYETLRARTRREGFSSQALDQRLNDYFKK